MARTKISFGQKLLTRGVVRGRTYKVGGREFERHWPRSNRVTCDLQHATLWLFSGVSPGIKKILYFFSLFFGFFKNHITIGFLEPLVMSPLITAGVPLSIQNPALKGGFDRQ